MNEATEMEKQISEQINGQINEILENALEFENVKDFLTVVGHFPQFSWKNLLLIWKQSPQSLYLAGKEAYLAAGRELKPDAKPILLLYPMFVMVKPGEPDMSMGHITVSKMTGVMYKTEPVYEYRYKPVKVYEVSSTVGKKSYIKGDFTFSLKNIKKISGFTVRPPKEGDNLKPFERGKIVITETEKGEKGFFVIKEGLSDEEADRTLAKLYIENELDKCYAESTEFDGSNVYDEFDKNVLIAIKKYVTYAVLSYFYMKTDDIFSGALQKEISALPIEKKRLFVKLICQKSSEYIMDLSDKLTLTFDETAIANSLLHTSEYSEAYISFINVALRVKDIDLREEIMEFAEKLHVSKDGYLQKLIEMIDQHKLYTYPPFEFEMHQCER